MAGIDLFSAGGAAGFDEGWSEGSIDATGGVTLGVDASVCHGIDLGADIAAAAEANAHLRLVVIGARANVGVQASAGVRGRLTVKPNIFDEFGLTARIEAAAEIAARARLEIALEADYVAERAAEQLDGLAVDLFLAFLRELRVGGGIAGKVAYSAMARARIEAAGRLGDDDDAGFTIGGGYAVGLEGGYGLEYFMRIGFENPRRFFTTSVDLIVDEIVEALRAELPVGSEIGIDLFRLLVPVALNAAYDVGQAGLAGGITTPEQIVRPVLVTVAEELQRYLVDKAAEYGARLVGDLVAEAVVRLTGREVSPSQRDAIVAAATSLQQALGDGRFDPDDVDEVLRLGFAIAEAADPEMVARFREPATVLWTASAVSVALRDVGALVAGGEVSILGFGVGARARIRRMPPVSSMPDVVVQEYLAEVPDFDGTDLTFDHAMDYLIGVGTGPALAEHLPEVAGVLDQLHRATGISPGNIATFGIQGALGGDVTETELYEELKSFIRTSVDEVIRTQVFARFEQAADGHPDAQLYLDEVARPSIELLVGFVFDQLDLAIGDVSVLGTLDYFTKLQTGISSLLYKIVARNLVVLEQIAAQHVREGAVSAFAALENAVRSDDANALAQASVEHVDLVLQQLSSHVPVLPTATGLTDDQVTAIVEFAAEMLDIAQESFGDEVFTDARWNRRREAILALLLSLDGEVFDWSDPNVVENAIDTMLGCAFVPDREALDDLLAVTLDVLGDQVAILLRRLPQPLGELMAALAGPQLEQTASFAAAITAGLDEALGLARDAYEQLVSLIGQTASLVAAAAAELQGLVDDAVDAVGGFQAASLRSALVTAGQANLRDAGEDAGLTDAVLDPIVAGFGAVLDAAFGSIAALIDGIVPDLATDDFVTDALAVSLAGVTSTDLVVAGSGDAFESDAQAAFLEAVEDAIRALLVPPGLPVPPMFTVSVPTPAGHLEAVGPGDVVAAVVGALVELVPPLPLVGAALDHAYHAAMRAAHEAKLASSEADVSAAESNHDAKRPRPGATVDVLSPTELDPRPDRTYLHGPNVPLTVRVDGAGAGWAEGDGKRILVAVNGSVVEFGPAAWRYEPGREELWLDVELRHADGHVRAGLNVLEIDVVDDDDAGAEHVRSRTTFLVDPDAPSAVVRIDPESSRFDSPGSDHASTYEEFVAIRWDGPGGLDLEGWELTDRAGHRYTFGPGRVRPGRVVRVRTGGDPADDGESDRHWGRRRAVWNNRGDTVSLVDAERRLRARHVYRGRR